MRCHLWVLDNSGTWHYLGIHNQRSSDASLYLQIQGARFQGGSQFFVMRA